jgi:hypothetical protein
VSLSVPQSGMRSSACAPGAAFAILDCNPPLTGMSSNPALLHRQKFRTPALFQTAPGSTVH